ncbi:low-specificity L-threonine aldolase [Vallitalea guaymasensis]|uniref:low-specificity L-threonine aldolase n=1 Tax=Vallitalea guaymasensis TaxID=1185412 RepID=UPI000DE43B14|nr:low-specificity L-threonine aldolase [Vallitalea guaymasensis]
MIDLRSDTVTNPTTKMREAMYNAVVGDDVYGDDPTVNELEEYAAKLVGKEAALFVPSGTFGNQVSLLTHCNRGDEVILGDDCHIVQHEVGSSSVIAGVQLRTLTSNKGILDVEEIKSKIREDDLHYPKTGLICVENAHSNGRVIPIEVLKEIYSVAKNHDIPIHLDGARLFNAAAALDVEAKEITGYCDSVMFCLSKGLCAPVGSIVAGTKTFIDKARKNRKLMGGGLRQSGILAAAGLVALKDMTKRLHLDHENAKNLAAKLNDLDNIQVFLEDTHINMVFFKITKDIDYDDIISYYNKKDIKVNGPENGIMRFVTNNDVSEKDVDYIVKCTNEYLNKQ